MNATLCVQCTDVADVARVSQCLCYCTRITRITVAFAFSQSFLPVRLHGRRRLAAIICLLFSVGPGNQLIYKKQIDKLLKFRKL